MLKSLILREISSNKLSVKNVAKEGYFSSLFNLKFEYDFGNIKEVKQYRDFHLNGISHSKDLPIDIFTNSKLSIILFSSGLCIQINHQNNSNKVSIEVLNSSIMERILVLFHYEGCKKAFFVCNNDNWYWCLKGVSLENNSTSILLANINSEDWPSFLQFDDINMLLFAHHCNEKFVVCKVYDLMDWKFLYQFHNSAPSVKICKGFYMIHEESAFSISIFIHDIKTGKLLNTMIIPNDGERLDFFIPYCGKILLKLENQELRIYQIFNSRNYSMAAVEDGAHYIVPLNHEFFIIRKNNSHVEVRKSDGTYVKEYTDEKDIQIHNLFTSISPTFCISHQQKGKTMYLKDLFNGNIIGKLILPSTKIVVAGNILSHYSISTSTKLEIHSI